MPPIQSSSVIGKNEDGRQVLSIPAASATVERVFIFAGLTTGGNLWLKVH
jgi:hypothetical protein